MYIELGLKFFHYLASFRTYERYLKAVSLFQDSLKFSCLDVSCFQGEITKGKISSYFKQIDRIHNKKMQSVNDVYMAFVQNEEELTERESAIIGDAYLAKKFEFFNNLKPNERFREKVNKKFKALISKMNEGDSNTLTEVRQEAENIFKEYMPWREQYKCDELEKSYLNFLSEYYKLTAIQ